MRISPNSIAKGINDLVYAWQALGLVLDSRQHTIFRRSSGMLEVTWGNDGYVLKDNRFASLKEYVDLLEARQYSALMSNGDVFQISFSLKLRKVIKHRLCWYPCPVDLNESELESGSVIDAILDRMSGAKLEDFLSKSPIRFDFDSENFSDDHPEVHLHMISENCRIPVKTPLCLKKFTDFIFSNFYGDAEGFKNVNNGAVSWTVVDKLTEVQRSKMHLNIF